jgi:MFS family permease
MIPAIGLMVGAYIFTRMVDMLGRADVSIIAKVFSVCTILVVLFGCFVLIFGGAVPALPPRLR